MPPIDNKEYQKRSRAARLAEGGKIVTVVLTADEAKALAKLQERSGATARDIVGMALLEAAKRLK